jgi:hypothetical protein
MNTGGPLPQSPEWEENSKRPHPGSTLVTGTGPYSRQYWTAAPVNPKLAMEGEESPGFHGDGEGGGCAGRQVVSSAGC